MTSPIEKRCQRRDTRAFVAKDTVDLLADKVVGIIGDRRMTKVHRYLGESAGVPDVYVGLHVDHTAYGGGVNRRPGEGIGVYLFGPPRRHEGVSFSVGYVDGQTEEQAAEKYHHPEKQWLGERRDITLVELDGWPGSPSSTDSIRIEKWNEHGVGQETLIVFDDLDPIQEIAWDVKGDRERQIWLWDEFCDVHGLHYEHPDHKQDRYEDRCGARRSTRSEDLAVLAVIAQRAELEAK